MSCVLLNVFLDILGVFLLYFCHFSLFFCFLVLRRILTLGKVLF